MVQIDKLKAEIAYTEYLMKTAKGKRLYDLQQYRKRMLKDLRIAERYLNKEEKWIKQVSLSSSTLNTN